MVLYLAEENKFYLLGESDDFGPHEEMIYVHEFTHALQQLHFDFDARFDAIEGNTDATYALRALVEGDARVSELLYMQEFLTEEEQAESQGSPSQALIDAFRSAPYIVQRSYGFPYQDGANFVIALYNNQGGWDAIDMAFSSPPGSTEQILHPEKYLAGDETHRCCLARPGAHVGRGMGPGGPGHARGVLSQVLPGNGDVARAGAGSG